MNTQHNVIDPNNIINHNELEIIFKANVKLRNDDFSSKEEFLALGDKVKILGWNKNIVTVQSLSEYCHKKEIWKFESDGFTCFFDFLKVTPKDVK